MSSSSHPEQTEALFQPTLPEAVVRANAQLGVLEIFEEQAGKHVQPGPLTRWAEDHYGDSAPFVEAAVKKAAEQRRETALKLFGIVYALDNKKNPDEAVEDLEQRFLEIESAYGQRAPKSEQLRREHIARLRKELGTQIVGLVDWATAQRYLASESKESGNAQPVRSSQNRPEGHSEYKTVKLDLNLKQLLAKGRAQFAHTRQETFSAEVLGATEPNQLLDFLVGGDVPRVSAGLAKSHAYFNELGQTVRVATTDEEAKILVYSAAHLGANSASKSRLKRKTTGEPTVADQAAAVRAAIHTLDPKLQQMKLYKFATLERRQTMLEKLIAETQFPGLERLGNQVAVRIDFAEVQTMIDGMVGVVAAQRQWSPSAQRAVRRAIDQRMYGSDLQESKPYATQILTLLRDYNLHMQMLFQAKIHETERQIAQHDEKHAELLPHTT
ncbi:MAG: hypothetical protein WAS36_01415 [Candidatus Saccharimonadales bacterium]